MKIAIAMVGIVLALSIGVILWAAGAAADRNMTEAPIETGQRARCAATYDIAAQIMRTRQAGAPLDEALAVSDDPMLQDMVSKAYRQHRAMTDDGVDALVDFFATAAYDDCMGGVR